MILSTFRLGLGTHFFVPKPNLNVGLDLDVLRLRPGTSTRRRQRKNLFGFRVKLLDQILTAELLWPARSESKPARSESDFAAISLSVMNDLSYIWNRC